MASLPIYSDGEINMEQKQLDELEESFTGEEFLDDSGLTKEEEIIIETARAKRGNKKTAAKKASEEKKAEAAEEKSKLVEERRKEVKTFTIKVDKESVPELELKEKPAINEPTPTVNPWEQAPTEKPEEGFFTKVSTWKVLTGVLIIVLIFSVLTQGFNFAGSTAEIPLNEAEATVVNYVNNNLLPPPFAAEVKSSGEADYNLYRVTLLVTGQTVDSYITKDGKLFFPQGFNTGTSLEEELAANQSVELSPEENTVIDLPPTAEPVIGLPPNESAVAEEPTEVPPTESTAVEEPVVPVENPTEFTITAKKWLFTPNKITVDLGKKITFTIEPQEMEFTFSLPGLGVEQTVAGTTMVEFTPRQAGTFEFSCLSCEAWRGMTGTLVVE